MNALKLYCPTHCLSHTKPLVIFCICDGAASCACTLQPQLCWIFPISITFKRTRTSRRIHSVFYNKWRRSMVFTHPGNSKSERERQSVAAREKTPEYVPPLLPCCTSCLAQLRSSGAIAFWSWSKALSPFHVQRSIIDIFNRRAFDRLFSGK